MNDQKDLPVADVDLAAFDNEYMETEVTEDEFEPVPDGRYQTIVDRVELTRTMKGDPMLKWALRVLGPSHEGRLLWRNNVMATSANLRWIKRDLFTCGLKLARLSELPANLGRLLDIKLEVTVKSKTVEDGKTYQSVYLNRKIKTAEDVLDENGRANDALKRF